MKHKAKHTRPIFRIAACLLGIFYLLVPLQPQVNSLLHELSHLLEPPAQLMGHPSPTSIALELEHPVHEHVKQNKEHNHEIIETVNAILDLQHLPEEPSVPVSVDLKIDKHIANSLDDFTHQDLQTSFNGNWNYSKHYPIGHSRRITPPPQRLLSI